ncbi:Oxysterol-binding protein-domain-containing protein [Polychytrium aggregatum]|uniref:Oxysterol-binding protein-domain-containing protein n=1 Tax=Polychytrium aggregatum TaxID=110093 RepID=UPI0022FF0259|nr:Oxysterol-binding protein-domain-containing protein [Polychytrium aggregatum]KAI9199787.1 Oxysterol-binding protein-domain-containing protein [Polychytrium aggregatum]
MAILDSSILDSSILDSSILDSSILDSSSPAISNSTSTGESHTSAQTLPSSDLQASSAGYPEHLRNSIHRLYDEPRPSPSLWTLLKSAIGKDLTRITIPVCFNEPLSGLQRNCEEMDYDGLDIESLTRLQGRDASIARLLFVGAFAMSCYSNYSSTASRGPKPLKPFNPLLGETFEFVDREREFRFLTEQVCHHPPVSASCCESPYYTLWSEGHVQSQFWGKHIDIHQLGTTHVSLPPETGQMRCVGSERYTWKKVKLTVQNLLVGKLSIVFNGDMVVRNWRTGDELRVTMKPTQVSGWLNDRTGPLRGASSGALSGAVYSSDGQKLWTIEGDTTQEIRAHPCSRFGFPSSFSSATTSSSSMSVSASASWRPLVHQAAPRPLTIWRQRNSTADRSPANFYFTPFGISLNDLPGELGEFLPPTDSRLRSDQRAMEIGDWDLAEHEKTRLEQCQRQNRKRLISDYEQYGASWWIPRWFVRDWDPLTREEYWRLTGEYWEHRRQREWPAWVACTPSLLPRDQDMLRSNGTTSSDSINGGWTGAGESQRGGGWAVGLDRWKAR